MGPGLLSCEQGALGMGFTDATHVNDALGWQDAESQGETLSCPGGGSDSLWLCRPSLRSPQGQLCQEEVSFT